jgi:hypothetical protein
MRRFLILLFLAVLQACSSPRQSENGLFTRGLDLGKVDKRLEEASGLVASIGNGGFLWTINDSGNAPEVFLIDDSARIRLVCKIPSIQNRDWEDISIGPGPEAGKNYLYIADIGDNDARYDLKYVYRFEEPIVSRETEIIITEMDTLVFRMPDGNRDSETILIDPISHDLFIVSKREDSVGLYKAAYPFQKGTVVLQKASTLPFTQIVAGNISPDGREVLLKNYKNIFYWKKSGDEDIPTLLSKTPVYLPYDPEPQGEAIAWARDGSGFYTLSESRVTAMASLKFYRRK